MVLTNKPTLWDELCTVFINTHTHTHTHTPHAYMCVHTPIIKYNFIFGIDLVLTSVNQFIEWDEFNSVVREVGYGEVCDI